ncbi:MAG: RNA polymerase sigma factor [Planctomycetaceae bacterium]
MKQSRPTRPAGLLLESQTASESTVAETALASVAETAHGTVAAGEADAITTAERIALVTRCLAGDPIAIGDLVRRYERLVYRICWRMLGHHQDAEDVTQEVFVRALKSLGDFDTSRRMEPWLLTIAVNRSRTALARRRNRPLVADISAESVWSFPPVPRGELGEELHQALQLLRDDHRLVFVLFHDQHRNLLEISELTGHPVGTIKTWLYRARRTLANHLLERGFEPSQAHDVR